MPEITNRGVVVMIVSRDVYLRRLIERQGNGLVKVITGVRRAGKSFLLFTLFRKHLEAQGVGRQQIISVQLDSIENEALLDPHALYQHLNSQIGETGQYYVFLDEIQNVPKFAGVLNGLLQKPNVDVYVTGSNSRFLSSDVLTEFRGRGDQVHVLPLSFPEYFSAQDATFAQAFNEYLLYGGMPGLLGMRSDEQKMTYLQRLFKETYLRDIVARHNLRKGGDLEELLNVLASGIGALTNPTKLADTFKSRKHSQLSRDTIDSYIGYLTDAFIIEPATRYDIKGKSYINTPMKYYFVDPGLRNARLNFRQVEPTHLMENIIYNHLRMLGYAVDVGVVDYRNRQANGSMQRKQLEVDFVANKGSERIYVQSAYALPDADKWAQEARPLLQLGDQFQKIIVVNQPIRPRQDENGISLISLEDFLLRYPSGAGAAL